MPSARTLILFLIAATIIDRLCTCLGCGISQCCLPTHVPNSHHLEPQQLQQPMLPLAFRTLDAFAHPSVQPQRTIVFSELSALLPPLPPSLYSLRVAILYHQEPPSIADRHSICLKP